MREHDGACCKDRCRFVKGSLVIAGRKNFHFFRNFVLEFPDNDNEGRKQIKQRQEFAHVCRNTTELVCEIFRQMYRLANRSDLLDNGASFLEKRKFIPQGS